jgi:hypothetical protein
VLFLEWWKDASFLSGLLGQEGLASHVTSWLS